MKGEAIVWGVEASPYLLKLEACLRYRQMKFRRLPLQGSRFENLKYFISLQWAKRVGSIVRFPSMDAQLDEYPAVPFLYTEPDRWQYDSSGIAHWLDQTATIDALELIPRDPLQRFVALLIDEAFDEFGLYMVHHNRWVNAARNTKMGDITAAEMGKLAPGFLAGRTATRLPRRQASRCPYLFSVAPEGYRDNVEPQRVPPSRDGFPPTHALLDQSWLAYIAAIESLLHEQNFLLGDRFTVADASAYGQLSMNFIDPQILKRIQHRAPRTYHWLNAIRKDHQREPRGELYLSEALAPLLNIIGRTFIPLMEQNEAAYQREKNRGETLFNEAAFDRGRALYDGELMGYPFRSVVKTFQVRVWRDLKKEWRNLGETQALTSDSLDRKLALACRRSGMPSEPA